MKKFLAKIVSFNWFKLLIISLLIVIAIMTIISAHNSKVTKEKIEDLNFDINLGNMPRNIEDAVYYAEMAADSCNNIDTGSAEDAADYAAEAAQYAKEAADNASDAYYHCATPSDLLIYCR